MVLEWLKAELESARFSANLKQSLQELGETESLITNADLDDEGQNKRRLDVLKEYRDWFKADVNKFGWQLVELNQQEAGDLKYIHYDYWNELSGDTRLVQKAAENIRAGLVVFDVPNDGFYSVAQAVEAGRDFPPIIIVEQDGEQEIVEGHVRATGYVLATGTDKPLMAIVGTVI